jgi:hypothetical protein
MRLQFDWAEAISESEWQAYRSAIEALRGAGIRFMVGGGFALATFTGKWRDTKDIDFYVMPADVPAARRALITAGFTDYYEKLPYDRKWIYRSVREGVIVDIIWAMANQRAQVDAGWFERTRYVSIRGEQLEVMPMEEFLWCKLYIIQRDHCDWPDAFNLIYARGRQIDWGHLIERVERDIPLLKGLLTLFGWLCLKKARELPPSLWRMMNLPRPKSGGRDSWGLLNRVRLFDTRAWFAGLQAKGKKLEV